MIYQELINTINELGINSSEIDYKSPEFMRKLILANKPELCILFDDRAYDNENIKLLIEKHYFNHLESFSRDIYENEDLLNAFLNNIAYYNQNIDLINRIYRQISDKNRLIEALHKANRTDLFVFLLNSSFVEIDYNLMKIFEDKINDVISALRIFNFSYSTYDVDIFNMFFLNGYYEVIEKIRYHGSENLINNIVNNKEVYNQVLKYASSIDDKRFFDSLYRIPGAYDDSELLEIIIDKRNIDLALKFHRKAWTIDLQLKILSLPKSIIAEYENTYTFNDCVPLLGYYLKYDYRSNNGYTRDYDDAYDVDNLRWIGKCAKIAEDIKSGNINLPSNLRHLYMLLGDVYSDNISNLVYILLDRSFDNISRIIDNNGNITPFFKNFLLFDYDYIKHKGKSIKNEFNDVNYSIYVDLVLESSEIAKSFNYLMINKDNLNQYFNNGKISNNLLNKLFDNKSKGIKAIIDLYDKGYELELNDVLIEIINTYKLIENEKHRELFINFFDNKKEITAKEVKSIYELILKINNSNSYELRKQADKIITALSKKDNYMEIMDKAEYIFTSGSTPEFIKRFAMYKLLFEKNIKNDYAVTSPILKSVPQEIALKIIFEDLFRVSLANNSNDIIHYLSILENGENLFNYIDTNDNVKLSPQNKQLLSEYRLRLEYLADYLLGIKYDKEDDDFKTISNIEKEIYKMNNLPLKEHFHFISMNDLILSSLTNNFKGLITLKMYIAKHNIIKTAFEEGRKNNNKPLNIQKGDLLKGIESEYLDNIINYGSLSVEFLGESSLEDCTHLDTDMSMLDRNYSSIPELLSDTTNVQAVKYYDMRLIISKDLMDLFGETIITKDTNGVKEFSEKDYNKYELFSCNGNHFAIRTAFPMTFVKGIIASRNFDRARFIVSKNSYYIPIYDTDGKLIYSFEDYSEDRKNLQGLSYYDESKYEISNNLMFDGIEDAMMDCESNKADIDNKRQAIYNQLSGVFSKYFKYVKTNISSSVEKGVCEMIDTGSTGRNTNVKNDVDFDFIIRLDHEFINSEKFVEFTRDIYKAFNVSPSDSKRIRIDNAKLLGIDTPLKIEITIIDKTNKIDYSTDMCINDRLSNIKRQYPDKYEAVIANIIFAKNYFKKLGIYKTYEGGFGGVGVENFVLQSGGSFYDAACKFVSIASKSANLSEFKKNYHIYDYGKNHYSYEKNNYKTVSFPYDDYTYPLKESTFQKITSELTLFINEKSNNMNSNYQL